MVEVFWSVVLFVDEIVSFIGFMGDYLNDIGFLVDFDVCIGLVILGVLVGS